MKSWEINKSNRKGFGDGQVEKIHRSVKDREFNRQSLRRELDEAVHGLDDMDEDIGVPYRLKGGKKHTSMMALKREKGESVIPKGCYCYDENGKCPYWDVIEGKPKQDNGFCWFTEEGDWQDSGLRWDSCKSCGIKDQVGEEVP